MDNYYDSIAEGYDRLHMEEQLKKLDVIEEALSKDADLKSKFVISKTTKVLDVGCGSGISTEFFGSLKNIDKRNIFGIDPSKELVKIAEQKQKKINNNMNNIRYSIAPAESIPFKDHEFDYVISITAIQNFNNIEKGLDEIKRVGKDKFILTFLKKSEKAKAIEGLIKEKFDVIKKLEEDKDIIYFCE